MSSKRISFTQWVNQFRPIKNPFDSFAGIEGRLFKPFGEEIEFLNKCNDNQIWTLIIMDLSHSAAWEITNGIYTVNREGYLITEKPVPKNIFFHIRY